MRSVTEGHGRPMHSRRGLLLSALGLFDAHRELFADRHAGDILCISLR
jgi:hypothetical protein